MSDPFEMSAPFNPFFYGGVFTANCVFMQFTGVTDKNGKEIYEGDILKVPNTFENIEGIHEVYFFGDSYVTSSVLFTDKEKANKNNLVWRVNRGAFVIGNIYENPELLEGRAA